MPKPKRGDPNVAVGYTGVHDCSKDPTPNCYGSGYVAYDLEHDATSAAIVGYNGDPQLFDFGRATIKHGKALATERYITMPLSSNDLGLISQPGILHGDLSERPLDGSYRFRIWDTPDLNWNQLQDIQLVVQYDYWSQISVGVAESVRHPTERLGRPRVKPVFRR